MISINDCQKFFGENDPGIPDSIVTRVFNNFNRNELNRVKEVNRQWYHTITDMLKNNEKINKTKNIL